MSIKAGKADAKKLLKVIEQGGDSPEDAAHKVLQAAYDLYESKARFFTAVQIITVDGLRLKRGDPRGGSVLLGPFSTVRQATEAARSARVQAAGRITCLAAVFDVQDATPNAWAKAHLDSCEHGHKLTNAEQWSIDYEARMLIDGQPHIPCGRRLLHEDLLGFCDLEWRHAGPCATEAPALDSEHITGWTQTVPLDLEEMDN